MISSIMKLSTDYPKHTHTLHIDMQNYASCEFANTTRISMVTSRTNRRRRVASFRMIGVIRCDANDDTGGKHDFVISDFDKRECVCVYLCFQLKRKHTCEQKCLHVV